jgi:hypothetical protein
MTMIDTHTTESNNQEVQQILDDAADLGMKMIAMAFSVPASLIIPTQAKENAGCTNQVQPASQKENSDDVTI